jgi:hypothetical protein
MPKSVDIEDFSAKLGLAVRQLDWSRGRLAQQVGIDKSLAGRWIKGESRPTPHSLARLTTAIARTITGLKVDDWNLPIDRFALRIGADPVAAARLAADGSDARLTVAGLKYPPVADWGKPYLGSWAGFYQSLTNKGLVRMFALQLFIDDLGLRCRATEGNFVGEGPALASRSHLQCLFDVGPLHDRLGFCMFNGVHAPLAAVIDGLVCIIAGDSGGTPSASPVVLYRIDEGLPAGATIDLSALADTMRSICERSARDAARTGDKLAVFRELAPPEVFRALTPTVGDGRDHVLRMPASRSLAASMLQSERADWAANLRRALGLEGVQAKLRLVGNSAD